MQDSTRGRLVLLASRVGLRITGDWVEREACPRVKNGGGNARLGIVASSYALLGA